MNVHTYLVPYERAVELCEQLQLSPYFTHVEPSRYVIYVFDHLPDATHFRLSFDNAQSLLAEDDDSLVFLVTKSSEIDDWLRSSEHPCQIVECTTLQFADDAERRRFEAAL